MVLYELLGSELVKGLLFLSFVYIAYKWSRGNYDKYIKDAKKMRKRYGAETILLLLAWWVLTPSGTPDDFITLWLVESMGMTFYLLTVVSLSAYLVWRMRITFTVCKRCK